MKSFLLFSALIFSFSAMAQIKDYSILLDSRGDQLPSKDITRLQGRIRMGFVIDAAGMVEIVGLATTGSAFNNDWSTLSTSSGQTEDVNLAFRNLYLRKVMGKITAEAGALSPEPTVASNGLAPSGWIDGVRVKASTQIGDFKVVAGSLGDFKTANAFNRQFKGNFIEIEVDHKFFSSLVTQTAVEVYNGDAYVREDLKLDLKIVGDKMFKLFADGLYDVQRNAMSYELGADVDVLKTITDKYDQRLNMKLYFSNVNANIPYRSPTLSGFYTYGPRTTIQLGGKFDHQGNINWYTRASLGQQNRFDVGVAIKLQGKKKG